MYYLSVACIMKNEHLYAEEFVNYHRAVGVEHFFIYDNDSEIPLKETLSKYISAGIVDVVSFPGEAMQQPFHTDCLKKFGATSKWIAFIDCDEFMVPKSKETMSDILVDYEQFGGVGINWLFFGSDGKIEKPSGLVIENYTGAGEKKWCIHSHIKSIVQPSLVSSIGDDPHWFRYKAPYFSVISNFQPFTGSVSTKCMSCLPQRFSQYHLGSEIHHDVFQLNHYYTKSREEYIIRYNRGAAHLKKNEGGVREMGAFDNVSNLCKHENKDIFKFIDKTKSLYL